VYNNVLRGWNQRGGRDEGVAGAGRAGSTADRLGQGSAEGPLTHAKRADAGGPASGKRAENTIPAARGGPSGPPRRQAHRAERRRRQGVGRESPPGRTARRGAAAGAPRRKAPRPSDCKERNARPERAAANAAASPTKPLPRTCSVRRDWKGHHRTTTSCGTTEGDEITQPNRSIEMPQ